MSIIRRLASIISLGGLTAALAAAAAPAPGGPHATGPCADFGQVRQVCGLGSPEDIAELPNSPWLLVSQQDPEPSESGLLALDSRTLKLVRFKMADIGVAPTFDCPAAPTRFNLGGMGARRVGDAYEMVIINHGKAEAVERFHVTVDAAGPHLTWVGCVTAPQPYFLNDIAALPGGGFAATLLFDKAVAAADPAAQRARLLAGQPTGFVVRWSPAEGWSKVADSDGSFPNGIDASADGRTLYFAET